MPRPPGSDPAKPLFYCPTCRQVLTFHNTRTETDAAGNAKVVTVYFCVKHGFFHAMDGGPLEPGM